MYQKLMKIHIGNEIKQVAENKGINAIELGKMINRNRTNVYDIFKRNAVDTQLLILISNALDFNFFELFLADERKKKTNAKFTFEIEMSENDLESYSFPDSICSQCPVKQNHVVIKSNQIIKS